MANCEDAFGFPPYSYIEEFLQGLGGHDLKIAERAVVESALGTMPATRARQQHAWTGGRSFRRRGSVKKPGVRTACRDRTSCGLEAKNSTGRSTGES